MALPASSENQHADDGVLPYDGLRRRRLFGLDLVDAPDLAPVVDAVLADPAGGGPGHPASSEHGRPEERTALSILVTPNVDILVRLDRAPNSLAAEVFRRARYVLPDGMPVVAASRLLRRPLAARLPGSGLFEVLWPRLVTERRAVAVLCANAGIAERLEADHPDAACIVAPVIDAENDEQLTVVAKELSEAAADVGAEMILVGLGHPKDALMIAAVHRLAAEAKAAPPLCLGLGGSFAMYVGQQKRAPELLQRIGLEWFFRFLQEPRRLFRRYFIEDLAFLAIIGREWRAGR